MGAAASTGKLKVSHTVNPTAESAEAVTKNAENEGSEESTKAAESIELFFLKLLRDGNPYDAVATIFSNQRARYHYSRFMREIFKSSQFEFNSWMDLYCLIVPNYTPEDSDPENEANINSINDLFTNLIGKSTDIGAAKLSKRLQELGETDCNIRLILNMTDKFIHSKYFDEWRAESCAKSSAAAISLMLLVEEKMVDEVVKTKKKTNQSPPDSEENPQGDVIFRMSSSKAHTVDETLGALNVVDKTELKEIANCSEWLAQLISVVEDIPVCFSLASASKNRPGFPLIYVNAAFETTTLYSRDEVIGRNCKFLQYPYGNESENVPDAKEKVKIEKMGNALKSSRKLRVSLLNYRKDGSRFYNLFVMKPIFDQNMEYRFVVGLQCEVDESEIVGNVKVDDLSVTHRASRLNERLLQIIPDTVVFS